METDMFNEMVNKFFDDVIKYKGPINPLPVWTKDSYKKFLGACKKEQNKYNLIMEKTYKRVPFDLDTAKKIQAGEIEGRIVTDKGASVRILCYDLKCGKYSIGAAISVQQDAERFCCVTERGLRSTGEQMNDGWFDKLLIELPEEAPKHDFKPFDMVLVSQNGWHYWIPSLYRNETPDGKHICIDNLEYDKCIPYEGNEHLVGTTDNPE